MFNFCLGVMHSKIYLSFVFFFPYMLKFCFGGVYLSLTSIFLFFVVLFFPMLLNCCLGGVVHVCLLLLYLEEHLNIG